MLKLILRQQTNTKEANTKTNDMNMILNLTLQSNKTFYLKTKTLI